MEQLPETSLVPCGKDKYISKHELLAHLKNYNLYYEGQNLQLRHREEEGELIVEGLLNIFWGLRRPIRLQMQDDNERIRPPPSSTSWHSGCNLLTQGKPSKPTIIPDIQVTEAEDPISPEKGKLKDTDYPLVARILHGPCEQVCKVFLMEKDQVEEITYDVAQYIKFEMPVLNSFIQKLKEEEDREIIKLTRRYTSLRFFIEQRLHDMANNPATI
uniref:SARAH domain-containing protein n=1 Tax=Pyxicephalus adspersus TaxID=30357 RepID=A0AAV3AZX0_PYXAD|nr:TPA: hypothetical protein GDO54_007828 [Pyxicephalus adspersus]